MYDGITKYDVIVSLGKILAEELVVEGLGFTFLARIGILDSDSFIKTLNIKKKLMHLEYENAKDLYGISGELVYDYISGSGLNVDRFTSDYSSTMAINAKWLLFHMIIDEEQIDLKKIKDLELGLSLFTGNLENLFQVIDKPVTELDPDNYRLIRVMSQPNFSIDQLTQKDIDRLNNYHEEFMKKNIYPFITSDVTEEHAVLTLAKRICTNKKGFQ